MFGGLNLKVEQEKIIEVINMIKKIYNFVAIFCVGFVVGFVPMTLFTTENTQEKEVIVLADTLPLENGGEVNIELINGVKYVHVKYADFQYITKKRSKSKKIVESLGALFARLEG